MSWASTEPYPESGSASSYLAQREAAEYQQYMADKVRFSFSQDPFQAFFYLVAMNLDVSALSSLSSTVQDAANQIQELEWYVNQATKIKADFTNGKTDSSADKTLINDVRDFFTKMVPGCFPFPLNMNVHLPKEGFDRLIQDINQGRVDPILGKDNALSIINVFMKGFDVNGDNALLLGNTHLNDIWAAGEKNPGIIQPYLNAISTIESTTKGMSGVETSKMDYLEKQYMNVLSFLKSMFNYFYQESKAPVGKEET